MKIKKYIPNIVLAVVILIQIFTYVFIFSTQKTSFHEDEFFSYGLSNSYYKPFLYGSEFKKTDNYNTWLSGDDFKYYIRTNDDTAFSYGSVYSNQAEDTMPPLYHVIIHTISSLFKNRFSWWWGFSVNLVAFVITQVFLYLIFSGLSKSKTAGMLTCMLFGFSIAGQNTQLYIRMYSMLTMFAVMFVFFAQKVLVSSRENIDKKDFIFVAAAVFLGAMTHHLFLIFAFIYTLLQCIYFFMHKKFKKMFSFGMAAFVGVIVSFIAFPPSVFHMFFQDMQWSAKPDVGFQIDLLRRLILFEILGFYDLPVILCVVINLGIVYLILVGIIMRKSNFVKTIVGNIWRKFKGFIEKGDFTGVFLFVAAVSYTVLISGRFNYFDIMTGVDRYVFIIIPLLCGVIISAVSGAVMLIPKKIIKNIAMFAVCGTVAAVLLYQNIYFDTSYAKDNNAENGKIEEYVKNNDCILLLKSSIYLPCYCTMLGEADDVFVSLYSNDEYKTQEEEYSKIFEANDVFYLALDLSKTNQDNEEKDFFADLLGDTSVEDILQYFEDISNFEYTYCTKETTHVCGVRLYRFEKKSQ